jgi:hypothetical protein
MSAWDSFADWAEGVSKDPARRKRVAIGLIVLGLATLGVFHQRIYNTFAGPFAMEASELAELGDVPFKKLVRIQRNGKPLSYSDLQRTDVEEVEYSRSSTRTVATYSVLAVEGRRVLVRIEAQPHDEIEGVIREIDSRDPQLGDHPAQLMLDCSMGRFRMWSLGIAALGVLAVLLGLDQLRRAGRKPRPKSLSIFAKP